MEINTSTQPAIAAGLHITEHIDKALGGVLCLLSGGSSLSVVPYIRLRQDAKRRTIFMMGDERVSGEVTLNNYLQLRDQYPQFVHEHYVIDTSARTEESPEQFASRMNVQIEKIFSNQNSIQTIALLGMGADGHTAGIFPMNEESFQETYKDDSVYVPVHDKGLTIDSRASFSPRWLLTHTSELIGYITGQSKAMMLESLKTEEKPLNEMPAQIFRLHEHATIYTDLTT